MLETLSKLEASAAEDVLLGIVDALVPSPTEEQAELDELQTKVVAEIRSRLSLHPDDQSRAALGRIFELLNSELNALLLSADAEADIRRRFADTNQLPLAAFIIKFTDQFTTVFEPLGLKKSDVVDAVGHATGFNMDALPSVSAEDDKRLCLISRVLSSGTRGHTILVEARRESDVLWVERAWHIFHDDVPLRSLDPVRVLDAFAQSFGIEFPHPKTGIPVKFIEYDVIAFPAPRTEPPFPPFPQGRSFIAGGHFRAALDYTVWQIAFVFMIDKSKYVSALQRHGIAARESGRSRRGPR